MTSKTTNKFSPEVRARAVLMVLDHESEHDTRWAAVVSIAGKIGCSPHTLREWINKAEVDSGKSPGLDRACGTNQRAQVQARRSSVVSPPPEQRVF